jgi:D-glycero-alpha-D-manno-heptose-7-phosphate kinase
MSKLKDACIPASATIQEAFHQLNVNQMGILFVTDADSRVVGCITDGDIRRRLLTNNDLGARLESFMNQRFVWAPEGTTREQILKLLDHRVHHVPILDSARRLVAVYSRSYYRPGREPRRESRSAVVAPI